AIAVDAERLMVLAAIGVAAETGIAPLAVDVGLDGAMIAGLDIGDIGADVDYFDSQLMSGNARVAEERHLAEIAAEIGAADTDAMHTHERFAAPWRRRFWNVDLAKLLRLFELDCFHVVSSYGRAYFLQFRVAGRIVHFWFSLISVD